MVLLYFIWALNGVIFIVHFIYIDNVMNYSI